MMKITPKQVERVHRLVRELCANCDEDGNCILLDDVYSLSLSTVSTAIISRKRYYPATENCMSKSRKSTNQSKKRRNVK